LPWLRRPLTQGTTAGFDAVVGSLGGWGKERSTVVGRREVSEERWRADGRASALPQAARLEEEPGWVGEGDGIWEGNGQTDEDPGSTRRGRGSYGSSIRFRC
jgi:hypothetical protein